MGTAQLKRDSYNRGVAWIKQILIALAQGNHHVETIDEAITAARRRLLRYHVIERDGDIDKIEIPLFEQWVRERAILQR